MGLRETTEGQGSKASAHLPATWRVRGTPSAERDTISCSQPAGSSGASATRASPRWRLSKGDSAGELWSRGAHSGHQHCYEPQARKPIVNWALKSETGSRTEEAAAGGSGQRPLRSPGQHWAPGASEGAQGRPSPTFPAQASAQLHSPLSRQEAARGRESWRLIQWKPPFPSLGVTGIVGRLSNLTLMCRRR